MTVVLDTNVLVQALDGGHPFACILEDRDDDKFADCAIAVHADYAISEDKHFRTLTGAGYKPQPITPQEFIRLHLSD